MDARSWPCGSTPAYGHAARPSGFPSGLPVGLPREHAIALSNANRRNSLSRTAGLDGDGEPPGRAGQGRPGQRYIGRCLLSTCLSLSLSSRTLRGDLHVREPCISLCTVPVKKAHCMYLIAFMPARRGSSTYICTYLDDPSLLPSDCQNDVGIGTGFESYGVHQSRPPGRGRACSACHASVASTPILRD